MMLTIAKVLYLILFSFTCHETPEKWMKQFGYLTHGSDLQNAILFFQKVHNTSRTGKIDAKSKHFLEAPRCGNPDFEAPIKDTKGKKRKKKSLDDSMYYIRKWDKCKLRWNVDDSKSIYHLSAEQIRALIEQAIEDWAKYIPITFEKSEDMATSDLKVTFEKGNHGDGFDFDGRGGVVGHAFAPTDGKIHIDEEEFFTGEYDHSEEVFNLRFVAAHEIGHALGLSHSMIPGSLMFPYYAQLPEHYELSRDDQDALRALYGAKRDHTDMSDPRPWCSHLLDAAAQGPGKFIYIFDHDYVFLIQARIFKRRKIEVMFPKMERNVMAAVFSDSSGFMYLFKDRRVWKYAGFYLMPGYPKLLRSRFTPFNPSGAIYHRGNIYILKGNLFYLFDEQAGEIVDYQSIFSVNELILGAPHNLSRAFSFDNNSYLLTNEHIYVYDNENGHMLDGYPRTRLRDWLLC